MSNSWKRLVTGVPATILLVAGISGCSSLADTHSPQVDRYVRSYNAQLLNPEESAKLAQNIDSIKQQLQGQFGTAVAPETFWQQMRYRYVNSKQVAPLIQAIMFLKDKLGDNPGFTRQDLAKEYLQQTGQTGAEISAVSEEFLDIRRFEKVQGLLKSGQQVPNLDTKALIQKLDGSAVKPSRIDGVPFGQSANPANQIIAQAVQLPLVSPNLAAGVRIQGVDELAKQLSQMMSQGPGMMPPGEDRQK